jgi:hypothetical protein
MTKKVAAWKKPSEAAVFCLIGRRSQKATNIFISSFAICGREKTTAMRSTI